MKKNGICIALCLLTLTCLTTHKAFAQTGTQTNASRTESDQVLKEILNEVRQLRADLQRLNVNAHRTQALLDRMKVQQEQVIRLTREIGNVRDELLAIQHRQVRIKEALEMLEKQKNAGLVKEEEVKVVASELEELKQREQRLMEREPQLSSELDSTRATLAQLNSRLDELEQELLTPPASQTPTKKN